MSTMEPVAIHAADLTVVRHRQTILSRLNLRIKQGAITGLIGPSGSGKTTLMRAIVGVQAVSSGSLTVLGQAAGHRSLRRRIGYVTQSPAIYDDLTVEQNLRYFGRIVRATKQDVMITIDKVRLAAQRHQLAGSLSGGQKARVSLAIALLGQPDILILDEPTVGLDPLLRAELWDTFAALASEGKTLLVSSHVMDEAERCSELVLIRDGALLWNDSRQALLAATDTHDVGAAFIAAIRRQGVR